MYGTEQAKRFETHVLTFENGSEQRWLSTRELWRGVLVFSSVSGYDLATVQGFFRSMKGQFDRTWDITIEGNTWSYLTFESDSFPQIENKQGRFSFQLACRQVRKN
jgi:hypothetical protein